MLTRESHSVEQTEAIAAELAASLAGGECIALFGDLGAGKTQFVRGLVTALGGNPKQVSSPTFVLLHIYSGGRLVVYHLDAYRVTSDDLEAIGFGELLQQRQVVALEWAERAPHALPLRRLEVRIDVLSEDARRISIVHVGYD